MARSHDPQKGPTHHIHWSVHTLAVSSFFVRKFFQLLPVKSCLVMAKAKHLAGFIDAPVYPGTSPAVAKLTSPREHPTAKGPPRGPKSSRWRGSRATPKARALHTRDLRLNSVFIIRWKLTAKRKRRPSQLKVPVRQQRFQDFESNRPL